MDSQVPAQTPEPTQVQPTDQAPEAQLNSVPPATPAKSPVVTTVTMVVGLVLFLVVGMFALVAANVGKGNFFSQFAATLPIENIPLLNVLGKSDEELLQGIVPSSLDFALNRQAGGSEWEGSMQIYGSGTSEDGQKLSLDMHMNGASAVNDKGDQMKASYVLGGKMSAGVVSVDLGESGIMYDLLMPNANELFFSVDLSPQLKDMIRPYFAEIDAELFSGNLNLPIRSTEELFGAYWKLDVQEYTEYINELMGNTDAPTYDFEKYNAAAEKLVREVGPELEKVYASTLGDFSRYAKVQDYGREDVHGKVARVIGLEVTNGSVPPIMAEFIEGVFGVIKSQPMAFQEFCEAISSSEDEKSACADSFTEEKLAEMTLTEDDKTEIQDGMREMLRLVTFSTVKFYISPVDNSMLKFELVMDASQEALNEMRNEGMDVDTAGISMSMAEVSRGQELNIAAPATYYDLMDVVRELMSGAMLMSNTAYPSGMEFETANPLTPVYPGSTGTGYMAPEVQDMLADPAYQQMMQQYYDPAY